MFTESSDSEREKWAQSIAKRGFHCERGVKVDTFLFTHPIRAVIQEQNLQFVCAEVQGYLQTLVREFYSNLRENQHVDTLLETTVMGKQLKISPDSIAHLCSMSARPHMTDLTLSRPFLSSMPGCLLMPCAPLRSPWEVLCVRSSFQGSSSLNML